MKHVTCRAMSGLTGMLLATTLLASSALPAFADTHHLAYSDKLKVDVEALGGRNWCGPQVTLDLNMEPGSPLIGHIPVQIQLMHELGGIISRQCPQALATEVIIQTTNNGVDTVAGSYVGSASSNWQFSSPPPSPTTAAQSASGATGSASASEKSPPSGVSPSTATAAAPVPASTSSAPAAATPAPPAFVLPPYTNYQAVLLHYLRDNPSEANDPQVIQWWTAQAFGNEYRAVQFQEFKLQPLLRAGQANLHQALSRIDDSIVVLFRTNLGSYDFAKNQYPLQLGNNVFSVNQPWGAPASPINTFQITADLDDITDVPLPQSAAAAYEAAHTGFNGAVDRSVIVALKLKLAPGAFSGQTLFNPAATATVESAAIYAPNGRFGQIIPSKETPIAIITAAQIDAMRNAKIAAAAAAARAKLLAQRSSEIQEVSTFTTSEKLYNWLNNTQISQNSLNSLLQARALAIRYNQPQPVSMLVKTDGSGKRNVPTSWPGHLVLNAAGNMPGFSGSSWYLVSGYVTTSTKPGDLTSTLDVSNFYRCKKDECAEALDPAALVDRDDAAQLNH